MRIALVTIAILLCIARGFTEPRALGEGIAQVGVGNYTAAVLTLQPLEDELGQDGVLQYWLGRAYYGLHNYHLAAEHLGIAADRDGDNAETCAWHARALRMAGEYQSAADAYAAYAARFPQQMQLQVDYAATLALLGNTADARAVIAALLARRPNNQPLTNALKQLVDALSTQERLEPPLVHKAAQFTLQYTPIETRAEFVFTQVEAARQYISQVTGVEVSGFRVLLFADVESYARYARVLMPDSHTLHAVAFSSPGMLVLCSPMVWPRGDVATVQTILRHELAHQAILQRGHGEGLPVWLNEGMACYFGGWGGLQAGEIPARPLSPEALERAFTLGDAEATTPAYAQAHAMVSVMARQVGAPGLFRLIDLLAAGVPLPAAYPQVSQVTWEAFLVNWAGLWQKMKSER